MPKGVWRGSLLLAVGVMLTGASDPVPPSNNSWYSDAQNALRWREGRTDTRGPAKNVIIFIGDGMDLTTVTAARILEGQLRGNTGEEGLLIWERLFPHSGLVKTYNVDSQVPDSAGTASAIFTGVKTRMGVLGIDAEPVRGDCRGALEHAVPTLGEWVKSAGLGLGIVTTAAVTDATPGAVYAHSADRTWQSEAPAPCTDIARQLTEWNVSDSTWDLVFGGGRENFLPEKRADGVDLITEWRQAKGASAAYLETTEDLEQTDPRESWPVLGLFANSSMDFEADRNQEPDGQPSLSSMARFAIEALSTRYREEGFFLLVEAGRIDHGHHATDGFHALTDAVELNNAVTTALELIDVSDTLVIVTSDHGHTTTFGGYAVRGNPVLGKTVVLNENTHLPEAGPDRAADGLPYTTLGYGNGKGGKYADGVRRPDITTVNTTAKGYNQQASVPMEVETHGGADVAIWAIGPESRLFAGTMEQNLIFHIVTHVLSLAADGPISVPNHSDNRVDWTDLAVSMLAVGSVAFGVIVGILLSRKRSLNGPSQMTERDRLLPAN